VHIGTWLITLHCDPNPQDPGHGSLHFSPMQAKLLEHSAWTMHSGLQFGGLPIYVDKQEQDGEFPCAIHWE